VIICFFLNVNLEATLYVIWM